MTNEEERLAYFYELGRALSAWSEVERMLFTLVDMFFEGDRHKAMIGMSYAEMEGFRIRLKFSNSVLTRALAGSTAQADWDDIHDKLRASSLIRNELAHRPTATYKDSTEGRRWALIPWSMPKGAAKDQPPPGAHCVRDIVRIRMGFVALFVRMANFAYRLAGKPEPFPKADEQAGDPTTLENIRRQIHEELGHPQQSSKEKRREEYAKNEAASLRIAEEIEKARDQTED